MKHKNKYPDILENNLLKKWVAEMQLILGPSNAKEKEMELRIL